MTSLYKNVIVCCVCVLTLSTVHGATTRRRKKAQSEEVWLSDLIDYDYMGDGPPPGSDYCPPVPSILPSGSCSQTPCTSDRACANGDGKCCYNGCIYTCLFQVDPPGFFDWTKEPRRLMSSRRSWLIDSPESLSEAEPCSTTPVEEDEDPLLCPHGYVCSIENQGDSKKGIPNSGHCVLEKDENEDITRDLSTQRPSLLQDKIQKAIRKERVCEEKNGFLILEGATVQRNGRNCKCRRGQLVCRGRRNRRPRTSNSSPPRNATFDRSIDRYHISIGKTETADGAVVVTSGIYKLVRVATYGLFVRTTMGRQ